MGAAWCRERAAKAQDSKSPFDRVIVKCVNQMSQSESQITQNRASHNFPSHAGVGPSSSLPPATAPRSNPDAGDRELATGWQEVVLRVPDPPLQAAPEKPPVAPPRKKRMNRAPLTETTKPPVAAIRKPATPTIYLEVDTPESRQRRNKSSSTLSTDGDGANEKRLILGGDSDLLRLPRRVSSSASMTSHRSITSVSDATAERLDNYLKSSRSFGSLRPEDMIVEMNQTQGSDASSDSDAWAGLDDWDLGIVDHHARTGTPPLTPTSQLSERKARPRATFTLGGSSASGKEATRRKRTTERRKKAGGDVKKPIDSDDSTNAPANFKEKPTEEEVRNASKIIKPSQIPLEDFLMQSTKTSLNENRCSLKVQVPSPVVRNSSFSFDFSKGLAPPRSHSPQITLPGTPNTPRSLSRCSSPFPKQFANVQSTTPPSSPATEHKPFAWTNEEETDITHATLLRMLNEYRSAADLIGEEDARKILNDLGIPENLAKEINSVEGDRKAITPDEEVEALGKVHLRVDEKLATSSGSDRSSMTPSLNELEVALSELLEASAGKPDDDDEDDDDLKAAVADKMSGQAEPPKPPRVNRDAVAKDVQPEITITICKADVENGVLADEEVERGVAKIESSFVPIKQEPVHVARPIDARPEITITVTQEEAQGEASQPKADVVDVNGKDVEVGVGVGGVGGVEEAKTQLAPAKPMLRRSRTGDDLTKLEFQN